jgi:hypothetical protein
LGARATWQRLQTEAESVRRAKGKDFSVWQLASAYLALGGDETKAFAILEQVTAMPSFSKDLWRKSWWTAGMAEFAVQAGKKDLALEQLATRHRNAVGVDYGDLKFNPVWNTLRGDPRFGKIVALARAKRTVKLNHAVLRKGATPDIICSIGRSSLTISAEPGGVGAASQRLIAKQGEKNRKAPRGCICRQR